MLKRKLRINRGGHTNLDLRSLKNNIPWKVFVESEINENPEIILLQEEEKRKTEMIEKAKKKRVFIDDIKIDHQKKQDMIVIDKSSKNKSAIQETQLVNIEAEVTLEGQVDIKKIKEIRYALRRRYGNRTNFRKIFKEWDMSGIGELSIFDAHSMINKLGIPINYNETRALIASSNTRENEQLNLEEFMSLIFTDNPALNIDLKKLKFKDEKVLMEAEHMEHLKNSAKNNIIEMSKINDSNLLKDYLRIRVPTLVKYLNSECITEGICDLEGFSRAIKKFPINDKYKNDPLIKTLFDKFKITESDEKMDYRKFIDHIIDNKEVNDFYSFKDRYVKDIKDKIDRNSLTIQESLKSLKENEEIKKNLAKEFEKGILSHKMKTKIEVKKEVNSTVPSTEFINKIFKNKDEYHQKHQDLEKAFSAHHMLINGITLFL